MRSMRTQTLADHFTIGSLMHVFPPEMVADVVARTARVERRRRLLPAQLVVYYVLAMTLFWDCSYTDVMSYVLEGLAWASDWQRRLNPPTPAAIFLARERLGPEPLELLFRAVAAPLADNRDYDAFYRGLRVMSLGEAWLDVPGSPANFAAFGHSDRSIGRCRTPPQLRLVGLAESRTHSVTNVSLQPQRTSGTDSVVDVVKELNGGMLCLADDAIYSFEHARGTGAHLLWRAGFDAVLSWEQPLRDGSYLARTTGSAGQRSSERPTVRVIEYVPGTRGSSSRGRPNRLFCTMLDPAEAPARELAQLYIEHWHINGALDDFRMDRRGKGATLRSKRPEGIYQETYAFLCTHHVLRRIVHGTFARSSEIGLT
jgi:Insertion element 4 transposase N-terminal